MMKRRMIILILFNAVVLTAVWHLLSAYKGNSTRGANVSGLRTIDRIVVRNLLSNYKFSIQRVHGSGCWEIMWDDRVWMANGFAIERLYQKLNSAIALRKLGGDLDRCNYEVTLLSKDVPRSIKLTEEESNDVFFGAGKQSGASKNFDELEDPNELVVASLLNTKIFTRVGNDCKIFKIKNRDEEFVFAKRNGKWFLDSPASNLEVKNELIAKFFHEIFSMENSKIFKTPKNADSQEMSITLYGRNSSERVSFACGDGDMSLVENDATDLGFAVKREKFMKIRDIVGDLLRFNIFALPKCDSVKISIGGSGERFGFHNLKSQEKWQFTYAKNGELVVREIGNERVVFILDLLRNTESVSILSELPSENVVFTITLDDGTDACQVFDFYEDSGRIFVEPGGQNVKFEIGSEFVPEFFSAIKFDVPVAAGGQL